MLLNCKSLFTGDETQLPIDYSFSLAGEFALREDGQTSPIRVKGAVRNHCEMVQLEVNVAFTLTAPCDRCLKMHSMDFSFAVNQTLVTNVNDETNDDLLVLENYELDLDELITTEILLQMPAKFLCKQNCKGLCPDCGHDLNQGPCSCSGTKIDPRLEKLKEFLQ